MLDRKTIRLSGYDYSQQGEYLVTICIYERACLFGEVVEEEMKLSQIGEIAKQCWVEIPKHFPNVELDVFVVMPNHVHGIIIIGTQFVGTRPPQGWRINHAVSLQQQKTEMFGKPTKGSIPTIIRSYKSAVTKKCRERGFPDFQWQPRFHDHIIRDDKYLDDIRKYIANNPFQWLLDEENPALIDDQKFPKRNVGRQRDLRKVTEFKQSNLAKVISVVQGLK